MIQKYLIFNNNKWITINQKNQKIYFNNNLKDIIVKKNI